MAELAAKFSWPVRVYYEDTDNGGVVYYANYLKFMERARTEWLRSHGVEQDKLIEQLGVIFAVRSVQMDYLKPARFNQLLSVSAEIAGTGKASMTFKQEVVVDTNFSTETGEEGGDVSLSDQVLCRGLIKIACLDAKNMRPREIPKSIREEIFSDS